ncbi:MAG: aspartate kinase [Alphaproteobacteria bacterium]
MAARLVQKFGGTSVADVARLQAVAEKVAAEVQAGGQVAVVVSAMAGFTNQLVEYTRQISSTSHTGHHDVVLASGEQVTTGLLALALNAIGVKAEAFMGWQIPIITDAHHTNATIQQINPERLEQFWSEGGGVPIVAGFQGISATGRLTTLGRGGSDTTAVALAASLSADRCDIYTDVDGVYTADPRIVPQARKLEVVTYDEMLALSTSGAKVLHQRSVQAAKEHMVALRVLSSFTAGEGTSIVASRPYTEDTCVSGIVLSRNDTQLTLQFMQLQPGWEDNLQACLTLAHIPCDMISYKMVEAGIAHVSFVVPKEEVSRTLECLEPYQRTLWQGSVVNTTIARVAVVGYGISGHLGIAGAVFQVLATHGISIQAVTTTPIKLSILVHEGDAEKAVRLLHTAYGLDGS